MTSFQERNMNVNALCLLCIVLLQTIIWTVDGFNCARFPVPAKEDRNLAPIGSLNNWKGNNLALFQNSANQFVLLAQKLRNRFDGPETRLGKLKKGEYKFSAWVKLKGGHEESKFLAAIRFSGQRVVEGRIISSGLVNKNCWTKMEGGFSLREAQSVTLRLGGLLEGSSLMVAATSVQNVNSDDYLTNQNKIISQIRKRKVKVTVVDKNGAPINAYVQVEQRENEFPFGAAAAGQILVSEEYQSWFRKRFNWAVHENEAKWYYHAGDNPAFATYEHSDLMTELFQKWNMSIRGHTILWNDGRFVQNWVKALNPGEVVEAVRTRTRDVVTRYKGRFKHWDVVNEMLHFNYFENVTKNPDFSASVYRDTKLWDPSVLTFVNDYNVVETYDQYATADLYLRLIDRIESKGGTVDGIGAQGHIGDVFKSYTKSQLDILATSGKPVWITELDVYFTEKDEQRQADNFEAMMRIAFSHPAVEGIMLWSTVIPNCTTTEWNYIYDCPICDKCLANANFEERLIGQRYLELRKEWSTRRNQWLKNGTINFRGFFGAYDISLNIGGNLVTQSFYVPKGNTTLNVNIVV